MMIMSFVIRRIRISIPAILALHIWASMSLISKSAVTVALSTQNCNENHHSVDLKAQHHKTSAVKRWIREEINGE